MIQSRFDLERDILAVLGVREEINGKLHNGMSPMDDMLTYARNTSSMLHSFSKCNIDQQFF